MGTRSGVSLAVLADKDHPHACGDKQLAKAEYSRRLGSSPRVWGQVQKLTEWLLLDRIIPTRVGTSRQFRRCHGLFRDHPHACGDKGQKAYL